MTDLNDQTSPIKESPLMPLEPLDTEAPENDLELKENGCCYENTVFIGKDIACYGGFL